MPIIKPEINSYTARIEAKSSALLGLFKNFTNIDKKEKEI